MTTAIATKETAIQKFTTEELDLIKKTVAKDATDQELSLFLYTAKMRGLNPLTRQIHFVKRGGQGTIQTGIDGFRLIAERSGKYAPGSKPTIFEYDKSKLLRATVFGMKVMNGHAFEYSATAKYDEYKVDSNQLWRKMPEAMLEKCAEAKLLRKGFPEEMSGIYTDEEMAQADVVTIHEAELPETHTQDITQIEQASEDILDSDNPYASYLYKCPLDGDEWIDGQYGKSHKAQDGTYHRLSVVIREETQRLFGIFSGGEDAFYSEARGKGKAWFATDAFKEWLDSLNADLPTWSKIDDKDKIGILHTLKEQVDAIGAKSENPLVEEAKRLGAVEK